MKKLLAVLLVALLAVSLVACGGDSKDDTKKDDSKAAVTTKAADDNGGDNGGTPVATDDDVKMDFVAGATADNTYGEQGFWGPYTEMNAASLSEADGLTIDLSVTDAWVTTEVAPQEMPMKQYAILEIKTDDPASIEGFTIKFGGVGKLWKDWTDKDGNALPALTTDWQTITIDLAAGGVESVVTPDQGAADFAINKGEAASGKISVKSITFTNTAA